MKSIEVFDEILRSSGMSEAELRLEVAVLLFEKQKLTLKQASRVAGVGHIQFQHLLASRTISIHYDIEDFDHDLQTLKSMGRL